MDTGLMVASLPLRVSKLPSDSLNHSMMAGANQNSGAKWIATFREWFYVMQMERTVRTFDAKKLRDDA